ncbi:MAG: GAF domain-containing protein, partial [Anaerolineales bacterium]|nr:GAF domain-containing protein [Anaerolineales bacterium]
ADSYSIDNQSSEINHQTNIELSDSMAQRVLQTNQIILVDDTQNKNWLASEKDRKQAAALGARSLMLIPINVQARTWGLINIASSETNAFTSSQQSLMRQVVSLLESTLANQYLFDQTQMALSESETLYDFSARLNTASTLDEIVTAVVDATNAEVATLYLTENTGTLRKPAWAQITTHWNIFNRPPSVVPGTRLDIQDLPASEIWLARPNEVAFIDNIAVDHRLSPKTHERLSAEGIKAAAWVPLVINRRWIGLVALNWTVEHKFTAIEQRLYKTISTQTAVAFSQYRLTQEIQERAANLEKLAELETSLSQATTEENIVQTLAEFLAEKTHSVSLQYLDTDRRNIPISMTPVIMWKEGNFDYNDPRLGKPIDPQKLPTAQLWINSPNNVVYVEDCTTDERLGEIGRQVYKQLNIQSTAILPLRSGGIWQGTIAISSPHPYKFSDEQKFLLDRILESASAILSSRRAQMAQRAALAETETLYNASVAFNRAESIDEALKVIEDTLLTTGVSSIALSQIDVDENGRPAAQTITAIRSNGKRIINDLINQTLDLGEPLPGTDLWIDSPDEVQLVGNILTDPRTKKYPKTQEWLSNMNIAAIAYLPLTIGTRWVGLVTIQWDSPYHFDDDDIRLYTTLAAQAATAVDGLLLLQDTQTRATQLEALAQIEGLLSQAIVETDILAAIAVNLPDIPRARLQYIELDAHEYPAQIYTVATAAEGELHAHETSNILNLDDSPFAQLWLDHPNEVFLISNVTQDERLSAAQKDELLKENIQALAYIPLQAAGRLQGSISLMWPEPHTFTSVESYVFDQSQEPIAAVVASRRSQIEQKRAEEALRLAQAETQQLYNASRRINEAGNRLNEIASALGEVRPLSKIDRVILMMFRYNGEAVSSVYVAGNWWKGTGPQPTPVGTEYPWETNASNLPFLFGRKARYVDDPQTDPSIIKETKQFATVMNIKSIGVLPLLVGNKQVGTIILETSELYEFTEDDKRVYDSLLPQVTVAIENMILLDESQTRARREQILREVTEKVRSSTDVDTIMKTAVQEVGRALGRKAVVYLNQIQDSQSTGQG